MAPRIEADAVDIADSASIADDAVIKANDLYVGRNAVIEGNVSLVGKKIHIGDGTRIRSGTRTIASSRVQLSELIIGDFGDIWEDCRIYAPRMALGDYAVVQDGVRFQGHLPISIGHNFWIGSGALLNSSGGLSIGHNVGIGARSEIYSHGYHGEMLEGCAINTVAPVSIEDDAWLTGSVYVSPGVTIGRGSIVLFQSNVTKNIPPASLARGNPARVVEGFAPYSHPPIPDKLRLMATFLGEFYEELTRQGYTVQTTETASLRSDILESSREGYGFRVLLTEGLGGAASVIRTAPVMDTLIISGSSSDQGPAERHVTHFSLGDKRYTKRKTRAEVMFMKHMVPLKARFIPVRG